MCYGIRTTQQLYFDVMLLSRIFFRPVEIEIEIEIEIFAFAEIANKIETGFLHSITIDLIPTRYE